MHDDTDILDAFDRRLDPLVPTGPAPVTDLVRRGRARRTRRRGLQAGLAAAVVVVAAATATAVVQGRDDAPPPAESAASATPPPTADGTRTVGLGRTVVDVPAGWVATTPCFGQRVAFGATTGRCATSYPSVELGGPDRLADPDDGVLVSQHGIETRWVDEVCPPNADCVYADWMTVNIVGTDVEVTIAAPEGPLRDAIAGSVRPLPEGSVVVPDVVGLGLDEAKAVMLDAGLDPPDGEPLWTVGSSDPEAGSVVPRGTPVGLPPMTEGADDEVPDGFRLVDFRGVAVAIPQDWVSCDMVQPGGAGPGFGPPGADGECLAAGPDGQVPDQVSLDTFVESDAVGAPVTDQGGLTVQVLAGCGPRVECDDATTTRVRVVPTGVNVRVRSSSPALLETIVGSVRAAD